MTPLLDDSLAEERERYSKFIVGMKEKFKDYDFKVSFSGDILDGREKSFSDSEREEYFNVAENVYKDVHGDVLDIPFVKFHRKNLIQRNCNYGNLAVSCTGDVYFYVLVELMTPVVNIRNVSFERIIELSGLAKDVSNVENIAPCKYCELKYICCGDCRVKYFNDFANFDVFF